jgi:hypothetical protein
MSVRNVSDKNSWAQATSVAGPAVAAARYGLPGTRGEITMAWRGNQNSANLSLAYVVGVPGSIAKSPLEIHVSADRSEFAPALAYDYQGQGFALAWVGVNDARSVNAALVDLPHGSGEVQVRDRAFVEGPVVAPGGDGPPTLALDNYFELVGLSRRGDLYVATAAQPPTFGNARPLMPGPGIWRPVHGPLYLEGAALGRVGPQEPLYAAWTRSDQRLEFLADAVDPTPPGPRVTATSAQTSQHRPALAAYGGQLYVAWTGTDAYAHLNVAPVDRDAVNQGADPIDPQLVVTLTELSLGSPALVNLESYYAVPERLAIFWTGTDGAGTINGAIVYPDPYP